MHRLGQTRTWIIGSDPNIRGTNEMNFAEREGTARCRTRAPNRMGILGLALLALAGCDKEKMRSDPRDVAWAHRVADDCPAIAPTLATAKSDGLISIADLERITGALATAHSSPVKGQVCNPRFLTPTSTRDVTVEDAPLITTTMVYMPDGRGGGMMMPQTQIIPQSHVIPATE